MQYLNRLFEVIAEIEIANAAVIIIGVILLVFITSKEDSSIVAATVVVGIVGIAFIVYAKYRSEN